jgi:AcrR family transcriptional regulator
MSMNTAPARMPAGPKLQLEVTEAITSAFFEELADVGYGRLSIDAVARRAGVGKAAIYRRWKSKLEITVSLIAEVAVEAIDVPDTGTLLGDVREYLNRGQEALTHRLASKIIPDLLAEGTRNPDLTSALLETVRDPRRAKAAQLVQRAITRGELAADTDIGLCLDFLAGPLYWRMTLLRTDFDSTYLDQLSAKIVAAMRA